MPKFDVTVEQHGHKFRYKDIQAETMDDACTKAITRAQRSIKLVSVAPSPEVRPEPRAQNAKQVDVVSIFEEILFGKKG